MALLPAEDTFEGSLARKLITLACLAGVLTSYLLIQHWLAPVWKLAAELAQTSWTALQALGSLAGDGLLVLWRAHPGVLALVVAILCGIVHIAACRQSFWILAFAAGKAELQRVKEPTRGLMRLSRAGMVLAGVTLVFCWLAVAWQLNDRTWPETMLSLLGIVVLHMLLSHQDRMDTAATGARKDCEVTFHEVSVLGMALFCCIAGASVASGPLALLTGVVGLLLGLIAGAVMLGLTDLPLLTPGAQARSE